MSSNGDYPYNGDRDRPSPTFKPCPDHDGRDPTVVCDCQGTGRLQTNGHQLKYWDARHVVCPQCEASGVARDAMKGRGRCANKCQPDPENGVRRYRGADGLAGRICTDCDNGRMRPVCPDCRASARAEKILEGLPWRAVFGGDPRGYVLKIARRTVPREDIENGRAESAGDVIAVPS